MIRQTLRSLRRAPAFTLAAVLTLSLGMAASVTLFGALYAALLQEPPFPAAERLHVIELRDDHRNGEVMEGVSVQATMDALRDLPGIEALGCAVTRGKIKWNGPEGSLRTGVYQVDPGFARILGWRPYLGSWFGPSDQQGWVLSHRFWKRYLGGDPNWIGRPLTLGQTTWPVVGISRPDFEPPMPGGTSVDVFMPMDPAACPPRAFALVRLAAGTEPATAAQRLVQAYRTADPGLAPRVRLVRLREVLAGRVDRANLLVFATAGLMLALAGASVAGLFLARAAERTWETSLRRALGAPERLLFARFFLEGAVVALASSILGFLSAAAFSGLLRAWLPGGEDLFGIERAWAHGGVVAFTLGVGLVLALLMALVPVLHLRKAAPGRQMTQARLDPAQGWLVVVQVAVATLLLAATTLLSQSLLGLLHEDLGFRTRGVVEIRLEEADEQVAPDPEASSPAAVASMHRALQALRARPGIQAAALGSLSLNLMGSTEKIAPWIRCGEVATVSAGDGFAELAGLRVLEGRTFSPEDLLQGRRVCLLDAPTARTLFPQGAVGQQVPSLSLMRFQLNTRGFGRDFLPEQPLEVIGVVAPIQPQGRLTRVAPAVLWIPSSLSMMDRLFVRSDLPAPQVRKLVDSILKEHVPILKAGDATALESLRWKRLLTQRQTLGLVGVFGILALALACLGIGGLMWGVVVRSTRELGIRAALGATPGGLVGWALRLGMGRVLLGLGLGLGGALVFGRTMASLLYGVSPRDPVSMAIALLTLTTSALLACLIPALRAARVKPAEALKHQ